MYSVDAVHCKQWPRADVMSMSFYRCATQTAQLTHIEVVSLLRSPGGF